MRAVVRVIARGRSRRGSRPGQFRRDLYLVGVEAEMSSDGPGFGQRLLVTPGNIMDDVAPDNRGLRDAVNAALRTLREGGAIDRLKRRWFE